MEEDILMKEFDSDIPLLSEIKAEKGSCKQNGEVDDCLINNNGYTQEEMADISKMFEDDFSEKMLSLNGECNKKESTDIPVKYVYKKEPSIELESDYSSYRTALQDNSNNLTELTPPDVCLEEEVNFQTDIEQNNIFLDSSSNSTDEDVFVEDMELSVALSDHNYISKEVSYKDYKNAISGLMNVVSDLAKKPIKNEIDIVEVSHTFETIKALLGINSTVIENSTEEDETPQENNDLKRKTDAVTKLLENCEKTNQGIPEEENLSSQTETKPNIKPQDDSIESKEIHSIEDKKCVQKILDVNDNSLAEKPLEFKAEIVNKEEKDEVNEARNVEEEERGENNENCNKNDDVEEHERNIEQSEDNIEGSEEHIEKNKTHMDFLSDTEENEDRIKKGQIEENEIHMEVTEDNAEKSEADNKNEVEDNNNIDSDGNVQSTPDLSQDLAQDFPENCSEPLEYYRRNDSELTENLNDQQTSNEESAPDVPLAKEATTNNDLNSDDRQKLEELCSFGKRLVKSCEDFERNEKCSVDNFLDEVIRDFQRIFYHKNCMEMSVQTEHPEKMLSKEKQRRINEKEKERLLADSDSCSDEYDIASEASESIIYSSDEDVGSNKVVNSDNDDEDGQYSDSDGLDLGKYAQSDESDAEDMENKSKKSGKSEENLPETEYNNELTEVKESEDEYSDVEMPSDTEVIADKESKPETTKSDTSIKSEKKDKHIKDSEEEVSENEVSESSPSILKDEKLNMEPIVVLNKLTDEDLENYYDDLRDKEIDK